MNASRSAGGSGATSALVCVACLLLSAHNVAREDSPLSGIQGKRTQTSNPHATRVSGGPDWLDSAAEPTETIRACRSRHTEVRSFGGIRLIDVGDEEANLREFLVAQAHEAAAQHQKCLIAAFLPNCPSCASIGYALVTEQMEHALGSVTLIRIDVEEFEQDLRELGVLASQVPAFALLNANGNITDVLDSENWPSNDPAEFLPVLRDFVFGKTLHQRGGRRSRDGKALVKL